ncbi:MAG: type IX secretion system membrane protein PorP/SprF [Aureispira sp.]|nr:type IX secretion system membrane protein PorP/SprF [Aureispira sp.]
MHNYLLLFFAFLGFAQQSYAQQPTQYTLYMLNPYNYNSAYNGLDGSLSMTGVFRKQWVSFPGSPLHFNVNAHMPIEYISSGVGLAVEHDIIGAYQNTSVKASYSYIHNVGKEGQLSFGLAGRFLQKALDGTKLRAPQGSYDNGINHQDDYIPVGKESGVGFGVDFGIYFKHPSFEVGLSAINLNAPKVNLSTGSLQNITYARGYFLTASYNWEINDKFSLHPSALLKTDFVKFQPEISIIFKYNDNIFGGLSFRGYSTPTIDAVVFLAGMQITKNLMLAYSYDLSIGSLRKFNSGSHEVVLNYNLNKKFGKEVPAKVIYNPRFL